MSELRVKFALADKRNVVFYLEDGNTKTIKQGDPRLKALLEKIIPITERGEVAVVSLENFSVYAHFEEKTGGLVKLFRIAKAAVKSIFTSPAERKEAEEKAQQALAAAAMAQQAQEASENAQVAANTAVMAKDVAKPAVTIITPEEVAVVGVPVTAETPDIEEGSNDTIVAVVDGKVIPGMENLKNHMAHAGATNTVGMQNFLKRVAAVIDKRGHSVEDLLRFLEKGDLPIADDGSIIAYKVLRNGNTKGTYVDCHSRKVTQRVGSYVNVLEALVDTNRRNECSSGLHIARRGYIGGFSGDVCVLCKIAPEDVMTVPHGDANKVRVLGYHILAELPAEAFSKLQRNVPMTENKTVRDLLAQAISGQHIGRIESVLITQPYGGGLKITPLNGADKTAKVTKEQNQQAAAFDDASANILVAQPKDLIKQVNEEKAKVASETTQSVPTPAEKGAVGIPKIVSLVALALNSASTPDEARKAAQEAMDIKKKAKKSWLALGISMEDGAQIATAVGLLNKKEEIKAAEPKAEATSVMTLQGKPVAVAQKAPAPVKASKPEIKNVTSVEGMSNAQKIEHFLNVINNGKKGDGPYAAEQIMEIKKKTKKSLAALGLSDGQAQKVTDLLK